MGLPSDEKKLPYPKSVGFIIGNEFCERFCFYGMRAILVLYLTRKLHYDADTATEMFHIFTGLAFFFPIMGAIISDSWLGRFKTILYMSCVYMVGNVVIAMGAVPVLNLPANTFTLLGLFLIAFGTGGIKPCVTAFGGDQFKLPEQAAQLALYFSLFYMAINAGSLFSTIITPILREDVRCFGEDSCFSLAFGVPSLLMIISLFIFVAGKPFYKITNPSGNMLVDVSKCIGNAIWTKWSVERHTESAPRSHWLEYAEAKHGAKLVDDVKGLLKILVLYLPLPLFWALQDQQGSRWTFQAIRLDGEVGAFTIKPDQMHVINPVLIIVFIPLFDVFVYPLLARFGIKRSLQKLSVGMIFTGLAFFTSGVLELQLEALDPVLPGAGECQLRIFNGLDGPVAFRTNLPDVIHLNALDMVERKHIEVDRLKKMDYLVEWNDGRTMPGTFLLKSGTAMSYFVTQVNNATVIVDFEDSPGKPYQAIPKVRLLTTSFKEEEITFKSVSGKIDKVFFANSTDLNSIVAGAYEVRVRDQVVQEVRIRQGGVYTFLMFEKPSGDYASEFITVVEPNQMHILWQLPQYFLLTAGEILFSVTGLEFSFTESPDSMKSVIQACWQLTVTFGNLFVVVITHLNFFEKQSSEFFFFTVLMCVDVVLFSLLAMRYRYRSDRKKDVESTSNSKGTSMNQRPAAIGLDNSAFSGE